MLSNLLIDEHKGTYKNDLDNFLENKNLVAINNIDKNPSFYWVLYLLKLHNNRCNKLISVLLP